MWLRLIITMIETIMIFSIQTIENFHYLKFTLPSFIIFQLIERHQKFINQTNYKRFIKILLTIMFQLNINQFAFTILRNFQINKIIDQNQNNESLFFYALIGIFLTIFSNIEMSLSISERWYNRLVVLNFHMIYIIARYDLKQNAKNLSGLIIFLFLISAIFLREFELLSKLCFARMCNKNDDLKKQIQLLRLHLPASVLVFTNR